MAKRIHLKHNSNPQVLPEPEIKNTVNPSQNQAPLKDLNPSATIKQNKYFDKSQKLEPNTKNGGIVSTLQKLSSKVRDRTQTIKFLNKRLVIIGTILLLVLLVLSTMVLNNRNKSGANQNNQTASSSDSVNSNQENTASVATKSKFDLKSYVELVKPDDAEATSINLREDPCSENILGSQKWASFGQVIEGPITQACFDGEWDWYKVQWMDGNTGWSIGEYFKPAQTERVYQNPQYPNLKIKHNFNWRLEDKVAATPTQMNVNIITLEKADAIITIKVSSEDNILAQPCYGDSTIMNKDKQIYRSIRGTQKQSGESYTFYNYFKRDNLKLRNKDEQFDTLYQNYLNGYRSTLSQDDPQKPPYIELFMVDSCSQNGWLSETESKSVGLNKPKTYVHIEAKVKGENQKPSSIADIDEIVNNLEL